MEKLKAWWKRVRVFIKKYGFIVTILAALFLCVRVYYWQPPANVSLEFDGNLLGYMRPDFGLPEDLKKMGFKEASKKTIGMAYYDMLMGWLRNKGHKDADHVEIKVPVDGTLSIMTVSGWPDNPNLVSQSEAVVVPDQYVRLGELRADDPPFLLTLYCTTGQLKNVTFRYKEGDATRTSTYLVKKDPDTERARIVPEVFWGMDAVEIKRFARNCAIGVIVFGIVGYWQRQRIFAGLAYCWDAFVAVFGYCRNWISTAVSKLIPSAFAQTPPADPVPQGTAAQQPQATKKKKKNRRRNRRRR